MSADIEPPAGWRKVMGPFREDSNPASKDIAMHLNRVWSFSSSCGCDDRLYPIRIGSDIDRQNPPDYPAEWQGDNGWVKVEKPQPTTVRGWLETLPSGYRERALAQITGDIVVTSLGDALLKFAVWDETNEGRSFWVLVHDSVDAGICLPPLPTDPPESAVVGTLETTLDDDLSERIAIAIAPAIIAEWSYNNEDLPAEIAKLAKAIAGELRK
jgi:hypothetical protein